MLTIYQILNKIIFLSAVNFIQTLNAWNAPTGVLNAIKEKVDESFADGTIFTKTVDATTIKHIRMVKSDFDINQRGGPKVATLLQYASQYGNVDVVDALLDANADPNVCNKEDESPLMIASQKAHVQIVRKLLDKKADINKKNGILKRTALYKACRYGRKNVVDVLLDAKADTNICDHKGASPLMAASYWGHSRIVQKLLENNADISKTVSKGEFKGKTALSIAQKVKQENGEEYDEVVAILENFKDFNVKK